MAQVVSPKGWIGPLVTMVVGIILLLNGVPALIQWLPWIAQSALIVGVDGALETALVPLMLAGAATFIGFLMMRGGFGALRQVARGTASRAREQARTGVQQVRREVSQRSGELSSQAEHLVNRVPQSWRERIAAAASAVEQERAARAGTAPSQQQQRPSVPQGQRPQHGQDHRQGQAQQSGEPYLGQGRQQGQGQQLGQGQQQGQGQRMQQPTSQRQQPGGERLRRIDELRQRVDAREQQARQAPEQAARQAAEQARRAASLAAERAQQGLPQHLDEATAMLVGQLDLADSERIRRNGSTLVRSSLTTSALSKTSLRTNSLFRHR